MHTTATQCLIELERERELVAVKKGIVIVSIVDLYHNNKSSNPRSAAR